MLGLGSRESGESWAELEPDGTGGVLAKPVLSGAVMSLKQPPAASPSEGDRQSGAQFLPGQSVISFRPACNFAVPGLPIQPPTKKEKRRDRKRWRLYQLLIPGMTNAMLGVHAGRAFAFGGSLKRCAPDLLRWKKGWAAESSFEIRTASPSAC